jgi:hypothetical protein
VPGTDSCFSATHLLPAFPLIGATHLFVVGLGRIKNLGCRRDSARQIGAWHRFVIISATHLLPAFPLIGATHLFLVGLGRIKNLGCRRGSARQIGAWHRFG